MTSKLTRERLEELAAGQSGFNLRIATLEESQELARMVLDAMDSEPVATSHDALRIQGIDFALELLTAKPAEPDYAQGIQLSIGCMNAAKSLIANKNVVAFNDDAQKPAPVVPEDVRQALSKMDDEIIAELDAEESACRAAMLNGGKK